MDRRVVVLRSACALLVFAGTSSVAYSARIGGWNNARGGASSLLSGADFQNIRIDFQLAFPGHNLVTTGELTPAFLSNVDVLLLDPVFSVSDVPITPLSASEQSALTSWVAAGGRALIIAENSSYYDASRSMTEPFGVQWANQKIVGAQSGTIVDHASYPQITDGPYGNAFQNDRFHYRRQPR